MIDEIAVSFPMRVGPPAERVGDVVPLQPSFRRGGNQARRKSAGDRDVELLAGLDPADEFGRVLAQFAKTNGCHEVIVAAVLHALVAINCQGSTEVGVTHQPKHCHPSAEARAVASAQEIWHLWAPRGSNPQPTD